MSLQKEPKSNYCPKYPDGPFFQQMKPGNVTSVQIYALTADQIYGWMDR